MSRTRKGQLPSYRMHKGTGQAVVTVVEGGKRRDVYLGVYGSDDSHRRYANVVAGRPIDAPAQPLDPYWAPIPKKPPMPPVLTLREVWERYLVHARTYYKTPSGDPGREVENLTHAMREVLRLHGSKDVNAVGRAELREARDAMVKAGLSRGVINSRVAKVVRVLKWAANEEPPLVADAVPVALALLKPLARNRSEAREAEKVEPVPDEVVKATLPHLTDLVGDMVRLALLTGLRPGELCGLEWPMIDEGGELWRVEFKHHKTAHHGHRRVVILGPESQEILGRHRHEKGGVVFRPYLSLDRRRRPNRRAGMRYTHRTLNQAIHRACKRAGVPEWHANQLRHLHATEVRKRFGLEAAQVSLGHAKASTTEIYAERDMGLAERVARES